MKKITMSLSVLGIGGLLVFTSGCVTNQTAINTAAVVVQQGAYVGTTYAIQQNTNNLKYFVLADASLKKFVLGTNLSSTELENALMNVAPQLQNQWIMLGVSSIIVVYDAALNAYVIGQVTNSPVALQFANAVEAGIALAIQPYLPEGITLKIVNVVKCPRPSVVAPKFKK